MIRRLGRFLKQSFNGHSKRTKVPTLNDLHAIRSAMFASIKDCEDLQAKRLHLKIHAAATAQDLWMLRNDAYQIISQQHNQSVAADRINQLIQSFEGWVEPRQLNRIR